MIGILNTLMTIQYGEQVVMNKLDFVKLVEKVLNIKSCGWVSTTGKVDMEKCQMNQPEISKEVNDFYARIEYERGNIDYATMVKLVNTTDLKSVGDSLPGSSPGGRTKFYGPDLMSVFDEKM